MAVHEFGIMQNPPLQGERYDEYEPFKYNCISVSDDYLEGIVARMNHIDSYWHTPDVAGKGIAYCGITLIPPRSTEAFVDVIKDVPGLSALKNLLERAFRENKWVIHFGL